MPSRRHHGCQHRRNHGNAMISAKPSIPVARRILSAVLAALVTAAVMCIFPLLEHFTENSPHLIQHSLPVPVKISQFSSETSVSDTQQTVKGKATPQRRLSPVDLPPAPTIPKLSPPIILPPKPAPVIVTPPKEIPSPPPAPSVQNQPAVTTQEIPIQEVNDALPAATPIIATKDDSSSGNGQQTYGSDMPDGQSLKYPPILLKSTEPIYPEYSRRRNQEGFVILQFTVDIKGRVTNPSVQSQSTPTGHFEKAALRAIRQWRFSPGRDDNGTPIPCRFQIRIDFRLEDSGYGYKIRFPKSAP